MEVAKAIRELPTETERVKHDALFKMRSPVAGLMQTLHDLDDPAKVRELQRDHREREQAKLYRLIVVFAALSAIASAASVAVAALNA